jgi:hypothetical protein
MTETKAQTEHARHIDHFISELVTVADPQEKIRHMVGALVNSDLPIPVCFQRQETNFELNQHGQLDFDEGETTQLEQTAPLRIPLQGGEYIELAYLDIPSTKNHFHRNKSLVIRANFTHPHGDHLIFPETDVPWVNTWSSHFLYTWCFFGDQEHGWNDQTRGEDHPVLLPGDEDKLNLFRNRLSLVDFKRDFDATKVTPGMEEIVGKAVAILSASISNQK